jgi:hypothetical protein
MNKIIGTLTAVIPLAFAGTTMLAETNFLGSMSGPVTTNSPPTRRMVKVVISAAFNPLPPRASRCAA